ncbi:MAG: carboxypeptidase-like regulatory domain-containing protein [Parabacteroides sp.]
MQRRSITVSGQVVDEQQVPVIGASVSIKNSSTGTITDIDGGFTLQAPVNAVIQFSFIGYETVEVKATAEPMRIVLKKTRRWLKKW